MAQEGSGEGGLAGVVDTEDELSGRGKRGGEYTWQWAGGGVT